MTPEIILTHTGKLGDMLYSLPVASWLARERGMSIHFVLPRCFGPFQYIENLLLAQPFVSRVSLVDHAITNWDMGGQPYQLRPHDHGIHGEHYNLGFRHYPDKFIAAFYAEEHGFGYDADFRLTLGRYRDAALVEMLSQKTYRTIEGAMARIVPDAIPLPPAVDLLDLAVGLSYTAAIHTWFNGIAVLCWFADIQARVYRVPGHASKELYFPEDRSIIWHELAGIPEAVGA